MQTDRQTDRQHPEECIERSVSADRQTGRESTEECIERSDSANRLGERAQRRAERGMTVQTDRQMGTEYRGVYREEHQCRQTDREREYRSVYREE